MESKYLNSKIYKIICKNTGRQYIGSTSQAYLSSRLKGRESTYKKWIQSGRGNFMTSFDILDGGNYKIQLVEVYPCTTKYELHQRKRYWVLNTICVNKVMPNRTPKEYYHDNLNGLLEYKRNYYKNNRELIKNIRKVYYQQNKDKIKEKNLLKKAVLKCT